MFTAVRCGRSFLALSIQCFNLPNQEITPKFEFWENRSTIQKENWKLLNGRNVYAYIANEDH